MSVTLFDLFDPPLTLPATSNLYWQGAFGYPLPLPPLTFFVSEKPLLVTWNLLPL
jgi:hypothetical protein